MASCRPTLTLRLRSSNRKGTNIGAFSREGSPGRSVALAVEHPVLARADAELALEGALHRGAAAEAALDGERLRGERARGEQGARVLDAELVEKARRRRPEVLEAAAVERAHREAGLAREALDVGVAQVGARPRD